MSWENLADWWLGELEGDDTYSRVVTPLLIDILEPTLESVYLDLGAGKGHVAEAVSADTRAVVGLDLNETLVRRYRGPRVVADVLATPFRSASFAGAYLVLVLEHLECLGPVFAEAARLVEPGGVLAAVLNHPVWTAPGSTPIQDTDGEVLWRPGAYFSRGQTDLEVVGGRVTFFHRTTAELFNLAAEAGWSLETVIELPHHEIDDQSGIPRLMACRWRLLP